VVQLRVHLDFESASDVDIKVGAAAYAEHPSTRVLCLAWSVDEGEVLTWAPGERADALHALAADPAVPFYAWNCLFEHAMWQHHMVPQGFPRIDIDRWRNTQAKAMLLGLPASLDGAAAVLEMAEQKDAEGKKLMLAMAKGSPGDLSRLKVYCAQDVRTERGLHARLGEMPGREYAVYQMDKRINARGVPIDVPFARLAAKAADDYQKSKALEMQRRFKINPTQVAKIGERLRAMNVFVDNLTADTIEGILDTPMAAFYPQAAIEMLKLRQEAAAVSPKKYAAMLRAVSSDGRIRGMFQYCGALQTGRWSGRVVQLHNLKRPDLKRAAIEQAMAALRESEGAWGSLLEFGPVLSVLGDCVRPTIAPAAGVTKSDASQIEARVLAWLANETAVLDTFKRGEDVYCTAASGIYGRTITKADEEERQIGKVAVLALGYGGGKGAFMTMGRAYGVEVPEERAEQIKVAWRESNPAIVQLWADVDEAMHTCIFQPGLVREVGRLRFIMHDGTLWCRLPSGRSLAWHGAKRVMRAPPWEMDKPEAERQLRAVIAYQRPEGNNMVTDYTRGAVAVENICQAVSRDLLAESMVYAHRLPLFLHVHDELAAEGDCRDDLHEAVLRPVAWADGLPRGAETDYMERYFKK
jgi:DNA polymerase